MKIRVLIVDDEAPARARIRQLLKDESDFEIVGESGNGRQALEQVRKQGPHVLFLDVQMPRLSGFDVCEALSSEGATMPFVIFVTAYDQYALKAFDVHAIDYLLKPFDRERFQKSLAHARQQLTHARPEPMGQRLSALLEDLRPGFKKPDRLVFKQNGRVIFVRVDAIEWLEADGNYVKIHSGAEQHHVRETLAGLEGQLPEEKFMRISRSTIVNLERVKEFQPLFYGDYSVIMQNGTRLSMSRNFRGRLERLVAKR